MILQTFERLTPEFYSYGCYVMSIAFLANKWAKSVITATILKNMRLKLMDRGVVSENLFVYEPVAVFHYLGLKVEIPAAGIKVPAAVPIEPNEIEVLLYELERPETGGVWRHFVAGNGFGQVAYDPWGVSRTATFGKLISKRVFKLPANLVPVGTMS